MRVLHVAAEVFPLVKTGGLADVLGALPQVGARVGPWLPFGNAYTFTKTPWFQTFSLWWGPVGAALYFAAVAAAVFALALVVVTRRDP